MPNDTIHGVTINGIDYDIEDTTVVYDDTPTANSNNPVKSQGIKTAIDDSQKAQESLLRETVGWTGKNLLPNYATSQTINGVTFTINNDGTITANGTATANVTLIVAEYMPSEGNYKATKGFNSDASRHCGLSIEGYNGSTWVKVLALSYGVDEQSFNIDYVGYDRIIVSVKVDKDDVISNLNIYPMIRHASIADPTYEPYHESVEQSKFDRAEQAVLGAKNLMPSLGWTADSPLTITNNADGTITLNGTTTTDSYALYANGKYFTDEFEGYFISPANSIPTNLADQVLMRLRVVDSSNVFIEAIDVSNGAVIPKMTDGHKYRIDFRVKANNSLTNLVLKPMLRLASDPDDTYVPYAMTNKELTDKKAEASAIAPVENGSTASRAYAVGEHFYRDGAFCTCISAIASGGSFTLNTNYTAGTVAECLDCKLLNSNFDLDNLYGVENAGLYYWKSSAPSNSPENKTWCNMEVYHQGDNNTFQKVIWSGEVFYMRKYSGNPMMWKPWYKFTGTIVT